MDNDKRYAECVASMKDEQIENLDEMIAQCRGTGSASSGAQSSSSSGPPKKKPRTLEREPTLDSGGYPEILNKMDSVLAEFEASSTEDFGLGQCFYSIYALK